jgi:heat shock protein HspQ
MLEAMTEPKFSVGQVVHHLKFDYRGVIVEANPRFQGSDEWYLTVARSRPPKDRPWYRVLVHGAQHETYVAERHLEKDSSGVPVEHPALHLFFDEFHGDRYVCRRLLN